MKSIINYLRLILNTYIKSFQIVNFSLFPKSDVELFKKISRFELESSIQVRNEAFDYENLENFLIFKVVFYFESNDFIYNSCIVLVFHLKFDSFSNEFFVFQENDGFCHSSNHSSYNNDYDLYLK